MYENFHKIHFIDNEKDTNIQIVITCIVHPSVVSVE